MERTIESLGIAASIERCSEQRSMKLASLCATAPIADNAGDEAKAVGLLRDLVSLNATIKSAKASLRQVTKAGRKDFSPQMALANVEQTFRRVAALLTSCSGSTHVSVAWLHGKCEARSVTYQGDRYGGRAKRFRKTNVSHEVTLDPAGVPLLVEHAATVANASQRDGLPLIALYPEELPGVFPCVWLATATKQKLRSVSGWVAWDAESGVCYHSTQCAAHADKGLRRKLAIARNAEKRERRRRKEARRARLVARLCGTLSATVADAKKLGYCDPGIRAFQEKHGFGDSVSLPELVRTGNPEATRLALSVAHRLRRLAKSSRCNAEPTMLAAS